MNTQIDWIKRALGLCLDPSDTKEKKLQYTELECAYNGFSEEEKWFTRDTLKAQLEVNDFIYVFSHFIEHMDVEDFRNDLLDAIIRGEFNPYIGAMLEMQIAGKVKNYKKRRELHKKNVDGFQQLLGGRYSYVLPAERSRKRVVILTGQILSLLHAPTRMVLDFACVLQEHLGYEVMLFACPCDSELPQDLWNPAESVRMASMDYFRNVPMRINYRNALLRGYQINMDDMEPKEYSMMRELIYEYNPFFVLEAGIVNPVADLMQEFTTVVALEMSIGCPCSEAEILLRMGKMDDVTEREYEETIGENQVQLFMEEKMPIVIENNQSSHVRAEFGLPEDKFLIAVVGNRLDMEIDEEFIRVMSEILRQEPTAALVIIGRVGKIKQDFDTEEFENRVYWLGYCADLIEVYKILDLYVNPKRGGGGFSGVMALQGGIPVVTLPNCDVAHNVGTEFVVRDYQDMVKEVCRYITDRTFYEEKKVCAERAVAENSFEKLVGYISYMVDKIINAIEKKEK